MTTTQEEQQSIEALIEAGEWDTVTTFFQSHPEEIRGKINPSDGSTILHAICFISSSPDSLIELVVDTWPEAVTIQENRFGATPLHLLCWSSQRSRRKVEILLERMQPKDLLIRNRIMGSTALHSACGNNAELPVLQAIVKKYPPVLLAKTFDQHSTALNAVWSSHLQTIPGHMQIARILKGDTVEELHFDRFWKKCTFLAMQSFKLSSACPKELPDNNDDTQDSALYNYVLHGLLDLKGPLNMIKTAIKINPDWARHADADGNYPLHLIVQRRPFRVKDVELIRELLQAYPEAVEKRNSDDDLPIQIAIRERMVWEEGLGEIANTNTEILGILDNHTKLYPFLLAASLGGRVAVNTTYQLLLAKPHLIKEAVENVQE
ncbi:ankyrin repeat domain protein [Nitzschia inconspicua]|uniref:Ankyrin repeat domain protein n=1 Tax=Nitzschia inconspicua TaxID=303405 RepID=A0A9K3L2N3_9STRA|nr:ankyrin repeat domain protein [Nitzschia inconspicua]